MDDKLENPERILIVDDEEGLLTLVKITLNKEHYNNVTCVSTGTKALECIENRQYDLIILDVMLPDYCGFELCAKIRVKTIAPIVFLTAKTGNYDKLSGLAIGGDDYITKPFNTMELVARIKAIFRRQQLERSVLNTHSENSLIYHYGYIVLDMTCAILTVNGQDVECTAKELELMEFFCQNPNKVFTTSHLYDTIWGLAGYGDEKTVTIHISKLRKKILDDNKPYKVITNLRGVGYKFIPPDGS
ncbi:TPA: response regulator transcription factor [Clostridioides difficile]|nr:response regulator transcription factor [Clostridioides difficile]MDN9833560.1 response regulator transcription factor [Clostridioides difficile]HBF0313671.1 response regulator transcription factor [Clostridioides difficile]